MHGTVRHGFFFLAEKHEFLNYYEENVPNEVKHLFRGKCLYCKKEVNKESSCTVDIERIWKAVNMKRLMNGQTTKR